MILVIDDEVDVCELMADYLEAQGHEVEKAFNVPQALKAIKERQFTFIVCDLVLGSGKGESVLSYLRKKGSGHEKVPCLLVSGKKGPDDVTLGEFDCFLAKPFSEDEFLGSVASISSAGNQSDKAAKQKSDKAQLHPDLKKLIGN
jgi:DNA-binding NtrC family response regulator